MPAELAAAALRSVFGEEGLDLVQHLEQLEDEQGEMLPLAHVGELRRGGCWQAGQAGQGGQGKRWRWRWRWRVSCRRGLAAAVEFGHTPGGAVGGNPSAVRGSPGAVDDSCSGATPPSHAPCTGRATSQPRTRPLLPHAPCQAGPEQQLLDGARRQWGRMANLSEEARRRRFVAWMQVCMGGLAGRLASAPVWREGWFAGGCRAVPHFRSAHPLAPLF